MEIIFVKVDSHTGDLFNELADEICKEKLGITVKIIPKTKAVPILNCPTISTAQTAIQAIGITGIPL